MKIFREVNALTKVAEFMQIFNQPILDKPAIPSSDRTALRIELLQEELNELKKAIEDNDIVEVADAFADLQYVLSGSIHEFGMGSMFGKLFDEVHKSNLSKVCNSGKEKDATVDAYLEAGIDVTSATVADGKYLVYRTADRKVLKNIKYFPANLEAILKDTSTIPLDVQMAIYEKQELDEKAEALLNYVSDNETFKDLKGEEQADMYIQLQYMLHYSDILTRRIKRKLDE